MLLGPLPLRSLRRAPAVGLAGILAWLAAGPARADAPKDPQAVKAISEAMGSDYLETKFDKAEKRLRAAIDACGADGCTPAVKARLFMALGTVLAHGEKQLEDARDAFVEGLGLDPNAKPDPDFASTEISFAFEQARAAFGAPASSSPMDVKPPPEQRVRAPVPIYAELRQDVLDRTAKVTLWYLAPRASEWRSLVLKKLRDRGYGINVPCDELRAEGPLRYYAVAIDKDGAILASAGTRDAPLTTAIKGSISGEPPHWPNFAPPEACAEEKRDRPAQCLDDRQCNSGLTCVSGACVAKGAGAPDKDVRKNWFTVSFWPDVSLFRGENVCTREEQDAGHYVCLRDDNSRYDGTPTRDVGDNVNFGFAPSTLRVALAYDRFVLEDLTLGGRAGVAFNGASDGGASFLPLHLEVRAQYFIVPLAFEEVGVRPYGLVSAGLSQVDSKVEVQVLEDAAACGANVNDAESPCTTPSPSGVVEQRKQTLVAYKQAGQGFASIGAGIAYEPVPGMALNLALRLGVTFPVVTAVLSPEVGVALGF
jgi:hypothetical protein